MAIVTGPLHSFTADGGFAETMIFQTYRHRTYVKNYALPRNDRTPAEVGIRAMVYYLSKHWASMSGANKLTWLELATTAATNPFVEYFRANMHRWRDNRPLNLTTAADATARFNHSVTLTATPAAGQVTITAAALTLPNQILLTPGTTPPGPDCSGLYDYNKMYDGQEEYRRTSDNGFILFWWGSQSVWRIVQGIVETEQTYRWSSGTRSDAEYAHGPSSTGSVFSDTLSHASDPCPNLALAIYRSPNILMSPERNLCRAVVPLDGSGNATWIDTGQVGGKAGPPGGLPSGGYFYKAQILSLDGRVGTVTPVKPATVP